jgi:hypothetical protein
MFGVSIDANKGENATILFLVFVRLAPWVFWPPLFALVFFFQILCWPGCAKTTLTFLISNTF